MVDAATTPLPTSEEDALRAQLYDMLAVLLRKPPSQSFLDTLAQLQGDGTDMGKAVNALARTAAQTAPEQADTEFHALFIGLGRGELLPFASYYLTGFLNEKPLAKLRNDMASIGIVRDAAAYEPEDNIGSLCEMMAGLIDNRFGSAVTLSRQKEFFFTHIAPWAGHFFNDLEGAKNSVFYAPVGAVGARFMEIEAEAFRMAE